MATKVTVREDGTRRVQTVFEGESKTKQSFQAECDINNIMRKYEKTGLLTHVKQYGGRYGEFGDGMDYQSAMNIVVEAQAMFDSMPAPVRARFGNDPGMFLTFVSDPRNAEEMIKLGLAKAVPQSVVSKETTASAPAPFAGADDGGSDKAPQGKSKPGK